jgi:hypothetical protein
MYKERMMMINEMDGGMGRKRKRPTFIQRHNSHKAIIRSHRLIRTEGIMMDKIGQKNGNEDDIYFLFFLQNTVSRSAFKMNAPFYIKYQYFNITIIKIFVGKFEI